MSAAAKGAVTPPAVLDWVARVQTNGDPKPADATISAYTTWYNSLVANSLDSLIYSNVLLNARTNTIVTNTTPFFKAAGNDPWTNAGFNAGNFSINGIPQTISSYFKTGIIPSLAFSSVNNWGLVTYITTKPTNDFGQLFGAASGGGFANDAIEVTYDGATTYTGFGCGTGHPTTAFTGPIVNGTPPPADYWQGWLSLQRVGTNLTFYIASSTQAHTAISTINNAAGILPAFELYFQNINVGNAAGNEFPGGASFMAVTQGLNAAQDTNFYAATQTLLQTIGGGFV
jgi:hypothetical protein